MEKNNKRIMLNTGVMYVRLILTTVIGLLSSRFVLQALGARDYGLYSVVGGLITMLGVINIAMHTTTRRFINVEMGKDNGNLNRIFNICRILHFGLAIFIFLIAESIGMFYIYNYLNVDPGKLNDAVFVFQVSTISAAISIINVPYQALLQAYEKFTQVAVADILTSFSKLLFVISLLYIEGNSLRIYAVGMSVLTLLSLLYYNIACLLQWKDVVRYKIYKERNKYKEILVFNNYVALGATAYLCRTNGSNMLVNFFFGTLVNAAFAIGYTVESFCILFVNNLGSAATPQIAMNFANNNERSVFLTEILNKVSIYLMLMIVVPISLELDFILKLWLKDVPEGTLLICHLTLLSAIVRTFCGGLDKLIQASGKIKWFQIVSSIMELMPLPIGYLLFKLGFPSYTIIVTFVCMTIMSFIMALFMMNRILGFNVWQYFRHVLLPAIWVFMAVPIIFVINEMFDFESFTGHFSSLILGFLMTVAFIAAFGLNRHERKLLCDMTANKLLKRN